MPFYADSTAGTVVIATVIASGIYFFKMHEERIETAVWNACVRARKKLLQRKRREGRSLPQFPRRMRIIRHPDGQRETLALFEKD